MLMRAYNGARTGGKKTESKANDIRRFKRF